MSNLNNEIIKNHIKLVARDIDKEIRDNPENACEILERYYGCGFVETIFSLVNTLED